MARNERDRLVKERQRLLKRKTQIDRRLTEIEKEMDELLERARKKAAEIRGESGAPGENHGQKRGHGRPKMTLEY